MQNRSTRAGGFLLIVAILAGIGGGIAAGQLVTWTAIGLVVGIALAIAVWLIDRRRA